MASTVDRRPSRQGEGVPAPPRPVEGKRKQVPNPYPTLPSDRLPPGATLSQNSSLWSVVSLQRTRALIRNRLGRGLAFSIALVYGFLSMVVGQMIIFGPTGTATTQLEIITNPYSSQWWNYPAVLLIAPGGLLELPFTATVSTILVSIGVGIGMSAGLLLAVRILRQRRAAPRGAGSASALASLTPAMIALLTVGACCSTTAAAAAGIGVVAQASGTNYDQLLQNAWYLNVFQLAILEIALVAQEQLIRISGDLFGLGEGTKETSTAATPRSRARIPWESVGLRALLAGAGLVWTLSLLIVLTVPPSGSSFPAVFLGGIVQRPFVGLTAVFLSLFPALLGPMVARPVHRGLVGVYRVLLVLAGLSLLVGVPPPLTGWGISGLGNQLLGVAGVSTALGGAPSPLTGAALVGSWLGYFVLLGGFALLLGLAPSRVLRRLRGRAAPWEGAAGTRDIQVPAVPAAPAEAASRTTSVGGARRA